MRLLSVFALLTLVMGCFDSTPFDPGSDANMAMVAKEAPAGSMAYPVVLTADPGCPECTPAGLHFTPSGILHAGNGVNGFVLAGGLVGHAVVTLGSHAIHVDMRTGRGVGSSSAHVELTQPAVGMFDCRIHATDEGYLPPFFLYVETGTWFNCKGSGAFEGERMILNYNNAANPGSGPFAAVAQIW